MTMPPVESDLLRQMVRQVLLEIVPQAMSGAPAHDSAGSAAETVAIGCDDDLQSFARRIASASDVERAAIVSGATTFRLASSGSALGSPDGVAAPATTSPSVLRVEKGAVTERHVREAAAAGAAIHLGRKAVLTPLARDRARASRVEITREP